MRALLALPSSLELFCFSPKCPKHTPKLDFIYLIRAMVLSIRFGMINGRMVSHVDNFYALGNPFVTDTPGTYTPALLVTKLIRLCLQK